MSPALEVALPEWSPPAIDALRKRWAERVEAVAVGPNTTMTLGEDGLPDERVSDPEAERWDLSLGPDSEASVVVYVEPRRQPDDEFETAVGWPVAGTITVLAWKSAPDLPGRIRLIADLAHDVARTFDGVVALDPGEWLGSVPVGHLFTSEISDYADADLFAHIASQHGFHIAGYPAV